MASIRGALRALKSTKTATTSGSWSGSLSGTQSLLASRATRLPSSSVAKAAIVHNQRAWINIRKSDSATSSSANNNGNQDQDTSSPRQEPASSSSQTKAKGSKSTQEEAPSDNQGLDLFAQAMASQKRRATEAAADGVPPPSGGDGKGDAELDPEIDPEEVEKLKKWRKTAEEEERKQMLRSGRMALGFTLLAALTAYGYLGMPTEEQAKEHSDQNAFLAHNSRFWANLKKAKTDINKPVLEKLLPDPLPVPYQRPLTLCVELTDSLVHLEWDKSIGWRVATRPGVKQFLANLSRYYEVVIFTSSPAWLAQPVCQALDPHFFYAMYRLFREHTQLVDGAYVKDISQLNRDVSKTIILDNIPEHYQLQPENGVKLSTWKGERDDRELRKLETFFEELYVFMTVYGIEDVRPILAIVNKINPDDIAAAWAEYKNAARAEFDKRLAEQQPAPKRSILTSLFGSSQSAATSMPNIIDQIEAMAREERALAVQDAQSMQKQMEDVQKQQEEMIKKQMEENKKKGLKLWDYYNGAGAPQPGQPGGPPQ
ncbi:HAD-like domain-containing protein [Phlyctochytrium arcticum]|nr:HAD-like domain-containing protein [Phlyctochytrium arcticum]